MRPLVALSLLGLLAGSSLAQNDVPAQPRTWSRTYGGALWEQELFDARETSYGRVTVAGMTNSFGLPKPGGWLLQLDAASGKVRHQRVVDTSLFGDCDGGMVAADGGALFFGRDVFDASLKQDAWLLRLDPAGDLDWTLGFTRASFGLHFLLDAEEQVDGSWVVVGATALQDTAPLRAWLLRVSADGQLLWQHEYGGGMTDIGAVVTATSDGGYAIAGRTTSSGAGGEDAWVLKVDAAGAVQWQRTFGGTEEDQAVDLLELPDGRLVVVGFTDSQTPNGHAPWLACLQANGTLVWSRIVDGIWGDLGGVSKAKDGQLLVVGRIWESLKPNADLWCAKVDAANGDLMWQRAYDGDAGDVGEVVRPMESGGLLVAGTQAWDLPFESLWVQRTRAAGRIPGCGLASTTKLLTTTPSLLEASGVAVRLSASPITESVSATVTPSSAIVIQRCR